MQMNTDIVLDGMQCGFIRRDDMQTQTDIIVRITAFIDNSAVTMQSAGFETKMQPNLSSAKSLGGLKLSEIITPFNMEATLAQVNEPDIQHTAIGGFQLGVHVTGNTGIDSSFLKHLLNSLIQQSP